MNVHVGLMHFTLIVWGKNWINYLQWFNLQINWYPYIILLEVSLSNLNKQNGGDSSLASRHAN